MPVRASITNSPPRSNRLSAYLLAVAPGGVQAPLRDPAGRTFIPHKRKGALSPPLCCTNSIMGGASSQCVRNPFGLPVCFAFAARRTGQPFRSRDYHLPLEAKVNHVRHVSALKSLSGLEASL